MKRFTHNSVHFVCTVTDLVSIDPWASWALVIFGFWKLIIIY